ncbi:MAG: D-glycero-beta-D-manno-heptose 1-phosphate adenylyltransferase [Bdellovibrionaceae bacterium]|mgnify:CR=1 FL=1|nr:D-glycero-beta-D-manno-heptose 1-phosphate adenylyltransferase [Pseudobdellovibrionaceae bacterium]|tara:strand:+ start:58262 stop:58735 length:474 start_codon:yes stop_codon:yes gene_type:complete
MGRVILDWDQLKQTLAPLREGRRLVFTNGCFDILHVGHARYLQEAKQQGDLLLVALNSDSSVRELKGSQRPIVPESERAELIAALGCVDFVTLFSEDTPQKLIESLLPDVLVKGGDWAIEQIVGHEVVLGHGGEVKSLQFVEGRSTTNIVDKIQSQK